MLILKAPHAARFLVNKKRVALERNTQRYKDPNIGTISFGRHEISNIKEFHIVTGLFTHPSYNFINPYHRLHRIRTQ